MKLLVKEHFYFVEPLILNLLLSFSELLQYCDLYVLRIRGNNSTQNWHEIWKNTYIVKPLLNMNLNYPSDIVSIHCGILASKAQA